MLMSLALVRLFCVTMKFTQSGLLMDAGFTRSQIDESVSPDATVTVPEPPPAPGVVVPAGRVAVGLAPVPAGWVPWDGCVVCGPAVPPGPGVVTATAAVAVGWGVTSVGPKAAFVSSPGGWRMRKIASPVAIRRAISEPR